MNQLPSDIQPAMAKARKLEWWTLAGMSSVVLVMYFAMGSSQAMKTAFLEDLLGLFPAISWLIATKLEPRAPTKTYPYGFVRVNSLAFLASAVVLTVMGVWLLFEGLMGLAMGEHPTIGPIDLFGETVWLGWVMIGALAYSVVVPVVLGRMKKPLAEELRDKVLHTDADMQKADWQTGLAGIAGIVGVGLGFWWADAAAAAAISLSILFDGVKNIRTASAELLDSVPRSLKGSKMSPEARRLGEKLEAMWPGGHVRLRESGRYILADVGNVYPPEQLPDLRNLMGEDPHWRLAKLSFTPPGCARADEDERAR